MSRNKVTTTGITGRAGLTGLALVIPVLIIIKLTIAESQQQSALLSGDWSRLLMPDAFPTQITAFIYIAMIGAFLATLPFTVRSLMVSLVFVVVTLALYVTWFFKSLAITRQIIVEHPSELTVINRYLFRATWIDIAVLFLAIVLLAWETRILLAHRRAAAD